MERSGNGVSLIEKLAISSTDYGERTLKNQEVPVLTLLPEHLTV
jgi:hypothetical protein